MQEGVVGGQHATNTWLGCVTVSEMQRPSVDRWRCWDRSLRNYQMTAGQEVALCEYGMPAGEYRMAAGR